MYSLQEENNSFREKYKVKKKTAKLGEIGKISNMLLKFLFLNKKRKKMAVDCGWAANKCAETQQLYIRIEKITVNRKNKNSFFVN